MIKDPFQCICLILRETKAHKIELQRWETLISKISAQLDKTSPRVKSTVALSLAHVMFPWFEDCYERGGPARDTVETSEEVIRALERMSPDDWAFCVQRADTDDPQRRAIIDFLRSRR